MPIFLVYIARITVLIYFSERKGDDKDSDGQRDEAATDAQSVKYMAEENDKATQPASPSSRRFQAIENPETCTHGMLQTKCGYLYSLKKCISDTCRESSPLVSASFFTYCFFKGYLLLYFLKSS